jgi:hypothetical protein
MPLSPATLRSHFRSSITAVFALGCRQPTSDARRRRAARQPSFTEGEHPGLDDVAVCHVVHDVVHLVGLLWGWRLRGWRSDLGAPKKEKVRGPAPKKQVRTMMSQAQTRYAWDRAEPRFVPLGEREQGAWGPFVT